MDKNPLCVLIVGLGGCEHAFAWALSKSPLVEKIFCAPGNGDFEALVEFAKSARINLVVPCLEIPIVAGIEEWLVVVKASGLAAGKGVIMPTSSSEAADAIKSIMIDKIFSQARDEIIVEELLRSHEISINFITDGEGLRMFPVGQDAQRILDGNLGLNTGGMGVYAPTNLITPLQLKEVEETILQPTIDGMREEGYPFVGFICIGLMMTESGPKLIEYNARFGDPEAQTLLPLMDCSSDLAEIVVACTEKRLSEVHLGFEEKSAVSVVLASKGYPESYESGKLININAWPQGLIFQSGTRVMGDNLVTAGGRVLAVVSMSSTLEQAVKDAYEGVEHVTFEGKYYRSDIGKF
ncbi:phosphoribosylglycinamide synthetase [Trichoderma chlorosporum]